jgi:hypothetical protein
LWEILVVGGGSIVLIVVATSTKTVGGLPSRLGLLIIALVPWYSVWRAWTSPREIDISGDRLTARYWSGRERSWPLERLRLGRVSAGYQLFGLRDIADGSGSHQFQIPRDIEGYEELCALFQA